MSTLIKLPFKPFIRLSSKMANSSTGNRMRLGSSAPAYANKMSEATYSTGKQYWKDTSTSEYPYFYAESVPALYPIPYMVSGRGPPKTRNPFTHQIMRPGTDNTLQRRNSSQFYYSQTQTSYFHDDATNFSEDICLTATSNDMSIPKDERKWEYTTWGSLIGPNYEHATVGDGIPLLVMSYNILAPSLLENHRYLYNDCNSQALNVKARIAKFFSEIDEVNPDVLCLQEMEAEYYYETYLNEFRRRGYNGVFMKRTRDKVDGCAIMFKTNTLCLVEKLGVEYYQPHVDILNRDNIGLLVKLQSKRGKNLKFIVGTTHLLYNPKRQDVRMAQVQFLLAEIDRFAFCGYDEFNKHKYYPIILSGDFNMEPFSSGVRLLTEGKISTIPEGYSMRMNKKLKTGCLPIHFGINDQCQHYKLVLERLNQMRSLKLRKFEFDLKYHKELINIDATTEYPLSKENDNAAVVPKGKTVQRKESISSAEEFYTNETNDSEQNKTLSELGAHDDEVTIVYEKHAKESANSYASSMTTLKDSYNWRMGEENQGEDLEIVNQINQKGVPCSFGGREISHGFHFKNVYGSQLDRKDHCENIATTKQIGWVCVDYIFYSTVWSHRYRKRVEGNLKLIRRYGLLNRQQCKKMGSMPNDEISSDHFPLIAQFLLKA